MVKHNNSKRQRGGVWPFDDKPTVATDDKPTVATGNNTNPPANATSWLSSFNPFGSKKDGGKKSKHTKKSKKTKHTKKSKKSKTQKRH